jgi:amino acid permease
MKNFTYWLDGCLMMPFALVGSACYAIWWFVKTVGIKLWTYTVLGFLAGWDGAKMTHWIGDDE